MDCASLQMQKQNSLPAACYNCTGQVWHRPSSASIVPAFEHSKTLNIKEYLQGSQEAAAWALGEGFQQAAQCCISRLGVQKELGKLQELLAGLRKRFKVLRSAPQVGAHWPPRHPLLQRFSKVLGAGLRAGSTGAESV